MLEEASIECSDVKRQLADSPDSLSPILSENMDEVTAQQSLKDSSEKLNEDSSREVKGATKLSTKFISGNFSLILSTLQILEILLRAQYIIRSK